MAIPNSASETIASETAKVPGLQLARAAQQLSEAYHGPRNPATKLIATDAHRAAYLTVRLPATYAAIENALQRLRECAPAFAPQSILDLGRQPSPPTRCFLPCYQPR